MQSQMLLFIFLWIMHVSVLNACSIGYGMIRRRKVYCDINIFVSFSSLKQFVCFFHLVFIEPFRHLFLGLLLDSIRCFTPHLA